MKTAVSFIFSFIVMCVVGTVFAALIFMAGIDLKYLVAGETLSFFSLEFFLRGIFYTFPIICIIAQLLLILYIIRHPAKQILPFIMFSVLAFTSWCVLIPCDMQLADTYSREAQVEERYVQLSTGYFREEAGGVYYYTKIFEDGSSDGVFLDVNEISARKSGVFPFSGIATANASAIPYADVLVKKAVQPVSLISYPMHVYSTLLDVAMHCWKSGFATWFTFASLGLALFSLYGLQFFSSWKFLNSFMILLCGVGISFLNYLIYTEKFFPEFVIMISENVSFLSDFNPFIVVLNLFLFLCFAVYGVVMGIYRFKKNPVEEEEV